jgi:hypothetical protein
LKKQFRVEGFQLLQKPQKKMDDYGSERINLQFSGWFFDLLIFLEPQLASKIGSLGIFET